MATTTDRFETSRNFLATDKVPQTIFGIPITASEDAYTEEDLAFFREHPEAGGYYDMGEEQREPPVSEADWAGGDSAAEDQAILNAREAMESVIPFIKEHEGFRSKAYWDGIGKKWTVGYGQTTITGADGTVRKVVEGDTIDEPTASRFVEKRVRDNAVRITNKMKWTRGASPKALSALYDVAYNAGTDTVLEVKSPILNRTGRDAVGQDEIDGAIWAQIPTYVKSGGKKVKGLENRRQHAIDKWKETK